MSAAHAVTSSPRPVPRTSGTAARHAGQHVALAAPYYRLGHPRSPGLRLGDARAHQVQPGEERLDVGTRMVVPGWQRCTPPTAACRAPRRHSTPPRRSCSCPARCGARTRGHRPGGSGVEEVQDRGEDAAHRLAEIDDGPQLRVRQHGRRIAQVRRDGGRPELVPLCCPRTFLIPDTFRTGVGPRFAAPTAVRLTRIKG